MSGQKVTRRDFIRASSIAGGGLLLAYHFGTATGLNAQEPSDTDQDFSPNAFIRITPEGIITIFAKNPEMGQGVKTSLPMIIAEELEVDFDQIVIEQADFAPRSFGPQFSGGSLSIANNYAAHRLAGATARTMLIAAAAEKWGVPTDECYAAHGTIIHRPTGRSLGYGRLAAKASLLSVPDEKDIKLKKPEDFRILGKRMGGVDNPALVTGQALFGIDQTLPGMLYAVYEKCPVYSGHVIKANLDHIKTLPGVRDAFVVKGGNNPQGLASGVAIVADSTWEAMSARRELKVEWDEGKYGDHSSAAYDAAALQASQSPGAILRNDGDVDTAFTSAATVIEANYSYPFLAHATLEPQNCTVSVMGEHVEVWAPTQNPGQGRWLLSRVLKLKQKDITIHVTRIGGGFGRRLKNDYMAEAAIISQRVGAPVKLTWTREDDMQHDFYRPAGYHFLKGAVDSSGDLAGWKNHYIAFGFRNTKRVTDSGDFWPVDILPARFIENYHLEQTLIETNVPTGPLRAPASNALAFVMQSFIDELAHAAKRDPLEFRLNLLGADRQIPSTASGGSTYNVSRMKAVLRRVAEMADWGKTLPPRHGQGIAFYFSHAGYFAEVAEVSVSPNGELKVHDVWCCGDVGPIINPSGAEHQVKGGIIDGLSAAWLQEITIERGRTVQSNFHDYPLLRIPAAPRIHLEFIESDNPPTGLGEPSLPPLPPAVCNAIFAATGKRIRSLPITRHDLS